MMWVATMFLVALVPVSCTTAPTQSPVDVAALLGEGLKLFDDLSAIEAGGPPSVVVIATKHPDSVRAALEQAPAAGYVRYLENLRDTARRHTGLRTFVAYYALMSVEDLARANARALLLTALDRSITQEHTDQLLEMIRTTEIPIIGFCGGHHLIARAYGSKIGPMRMLAPGEADPAPGYHPGWFKEWGFMPVRILRPHPLFEGFSDEVIVSQMHAFMVVELGPDLENLAATDECPIQAFAHKTKLACGTQFHPEVYDEQHPDGEIIIRNFLRTAGLVGE